eukprot:5169604-Alexandrium_andersonii.AAC.1
MARGVFRPRGSWTGQGAARGQLLRPSAAAVPRPRVAGVHIPRSRAQGRRARSGGRAGRAGGGHGPSASIAGSVVALPDAQPPEAARPRGQLGRKAAAARKRLEEEAL